MTAYRVTATATTPEGRTEVTIHGPGIQGDGVRYLFANDPEADNFVQALNFAFAQGYREGVEASQLARRDRQI